MIKNIGLLLHRSVLLISLSPLLVLCSPLRTPSPGLGDRPGSVRSLSRADDPALAETTPSSPSSPSSTLYRRDDIFDLGVPGDHGYSHDDLEWGEERTDELAEEIEAGLDCDGGFFRDGDSVDGPVTEGPSLQELLVESPEVGFSSEVGWRLPGEFEFQGALLFGCHELAVAVPEVLAAVVSAACGQVPIVAVVSDAEDRETVMGILEEHELARDSVRFLEIDHDTMWIRDYGPFVLVAPGGALAVADAAYGAEGRTADDRLPRELAARIGARRIDVPLTVDGGNLLSNGQGICLTTTALIAQNDQSESTVHRALKLCYGCRRTVFLEPLAGEETGHVDMFATFTAPNVVVVGKYDASVDPENARILDRNAGKLAEVSTGAGPLQIVRVPMPPRVDDQWRTYTNVIYANGNLLVPVYFEEDQRGRAEALATFSRLLPTWNVVPIEAATLAGSGGTLHCVSKNVASMGRLQSRPRPCR